jgi:cytochrome c oxidase cbb3-type subunit I/II
LSSSIASQGGPSDLGEKQVIALIAYMQRLGRDIKVAGK